MTASLAPAATDRTDFRTVMIGGTKLGALTALAVALFLLIARYVPGPVLQRVLESLVVLAAGVAVSFLPAQWTGARQTEGIAGAAALGLWGTVAFTILDIVLRVILPFGPYPWTWFAIGGGSIWWHLPIWWMLGTYLAWMGALVTAGRAARGEGGAGEEGGAGGATLVRCATPVVAGTVVVVAVARLAGLLVSLPVETGAGFTVTLTVLALLALVRRG